MEETSFGVFTLKLMDLNLPRALRVSRLQVWLHPILLRPFPLMSVPLANAKMKPDARLHTAPAESRGTVLDPFRSKPRAVILSPSGKGEGGLKQVPKASLLLFGTLVTSPLTRSAALVRRRAGTALVHPQCWRRCQACNRGALLSEKTNCKNHSSLRCFADQQLK